LGHQLIHQTYIIQCNNYKDKMKIAKTPQNSFQLISLKIPTHVLTNSQLLITHPLHLSGLMCLSTTIVASLAVPWDFSSFSSDCSDRVPKRQRDGEGIETSICTVFMRFLFLPPRTFSPKSQRWKCEKLNLEKHIQISLKSNG